jgi:hypothetical protein
MIPFLAIELELDRFTPQPQPQAAAERLLALAEQVLEHWTVARGEVPTYERREGFRLLALHHQGARGVPSFNACRETCREIAYHYNLIAGEPDPPLAAQRQRMMAMLTKHLLLFVSGKLQVEGLGEFCCASRPLRLESHSQESHSRESQFRESQAKDASGRL